MQLSQRTLLNLIMLVLVGTLAFMAYRQTQLSESKPDRLIKLDKEQITRIYIQRPQQADIALEKRAQDWFITQPYQLRASEARIKDLLRFAHTGAATHYSADTLDLSKYALDKPAQSLRYNDTTVLFGNINAMDKRRYLQIGSQVYLVPDTVSYLLSAEAASYVGPDLLAPHAHIEQIQLPGLSLSRTNTGEWTLQPEDNTVSAQMRQAFAEAWQKAQALWAKPREPNTSDSADIHIRLSTGEQIPFNVEAVEPDLILTRPDLGLAYTLPSEQAKQLLHLPPQSASDATNPSAKTPPP